MAGHWQNTFQVGYGAIGHIMFFVLAAVGLFMFFVGRLQERIGLRATVTIGAILCGIDVLIIGDSTSIWLVYVWAFIMGTASCFIYLPGLTTVQKWFPVRRGLVSGIMNCMFGLSAAIMSPIFGILLVKMGSFYMCISLGVISLISGVLAAQFTDPPESISLPEQSTVGEPDPKITELVSRSLTVLESLHTRSFWLLCIIWALQGAASIAMVTLSTQFGLSKGWSLATAVTILTAFNITNGLSRLVMGYLSDIIGRNLAMSIIFISSGAAYIALPHVDGIICVVILAAMIGSGLGTLFAVSAPLASDCFGLTYFGAIYGLVFIAYGFVAAPLGPSLSGYILDFTHGNYFVVFSYLGIFCLISGVLVHFVIPPKLR